VELATVGFGSLGTAQLPLGGTFANTSPLLPHLTSTATITTDIGDPHKQHRLR